MNTSGSKMRYVLAGLLTSLLLAGCLNDSTEPTIDLDATVIPGTAIALPTATASPSPEPTPSSAPWLPALLEPGPPALVPPVLFFLNGPDAWLIDSELAVRQVTSQRRIRAVSTRPGAATAAIVLIGSEGGREAEEVRLVDAEGNESEPIYGPEIVADPGGNPRINLLAWSPDGRQLAIVRDNGSIWITGPDRLAEPLPIDAETGNVEQIRWSPAGDALLLLARPDGRAGIVRIVPIEETGYFDIRPLGSFGNACWLPGQARLIVAEDRGDGQNPNAGSMFTLRPDGSNRELLISAGQFGPAVSIGQLLPSPDGSQLAFTVETPNQGGDFQFRSLYIQDIASGVRRQLEVATGQEVSELWWFEAGLAWRTVGIGEGPDYDGVEPFLIEHANLETGETRLIYTSDVP